MMRTIRVCAGSVLLLAGIAIAATWFLVLRPLTATLSTTGTKEISELGQWRLAQKVMRRTGMRVGEYAYLLGRYGDEAWAKRAIDALAAGVDDRWQGGNWIQSALCTMTNQEPGSTPEAWQAWWEQNGHKPQRQWIVDGLRADGIAVDLPLDRDEIKMLLRELPGRYNAFRLMRDSGFYVREALDMLPEARNDPELLEGLLRHVHLAGEYPRFGPGMVIGGPLDDDPYYETFLARPVAHWLVCALIAACMLGGALLLRKRSRKREAERSKKTGEQDDHGSLAQRDDDLLLPAETRESALDSLDND